MFMQCIFEPPGTPHSPTPARATRQGDTHPCDTRARRGARPHAHRTVVSAKLASYSRRERTSSTD